MIDNQNFFTQHQPLSLRAYVRSVIKEHPWRWGFYFGTLLLVPLFEAICIGFFYLLINPAEKPLPSFFTQLFSIPFFHEYSKIIFASCAVFSAATSAIFRIRGEGALIELTSKLFSRDLARIVYLLFKTPTHLVDQDSTSVITSHLARDKESMGVLVQLLFGCLGASLKIFAYIITAVLISWKMMILAVLIQSIPIIISRKSLKKMNEFTRMRTDASESSFKQIKDFLAGHRRIFLDNASKLFSKLTSTILEGTQTIRSNKVKLHIKTMSIIDFSSFTGIVTTAFLGNYFFKTGPEILLILFTAYGRLKASTDQLNAAYIKIQEIIPGCRLYVNTYNKLLELQKSSLNDSVTSDSEPIQNISLQNMSYKFNEKSSNILDSINLTIESGDRILIEGASGQGKSTLLSILMGVIQPTEGSIYFNQNKISHFIQSAAWLNEIVYVSPDLHIFDQSLDFNVQYSNKQTTETNIILSKSQLKHFSSDLFAGPSGSRLSLGERSRLLIARFFSRKPSVVILDEATSHLDAKTEKLIMDEIASALGKSGILIVVAHKIPETFTFTRKFKLSDGQLFESGNKHPEIKNL